MFKFPHSEPILAAKYTGTTWTNKDKLKWEFIKENKKVRKRKEKTLSTKKTIKKKIKFFSFFLCRFLWLWTNYNWWKKCKKTQYFGEHHVPNSDNRYFSKPQFIFIRLEWFKCWWGCSDVLTDSIYTNSSSVEVHQINQQPFSLVAAFVNQRTIKETTQLFLTMVPYTLETLSFSNLHWE